MANWQRYLFERKCEIANSNLCLHKHVYFEKQLYVKSHTCIFPDFPIEIFIGDWKEPLRWNYIGFYTAKLIKIYFSKIYRYLLETMFGEKINTKSSQFRNSKNIWEYSVMFRTDQDCWCRGFQSKHFTFRILHYSM